jgi:hypothetical protein
VRHLTLYTVTSSFFWTWRHFQSQISFALSVTTLDSTSHDYFKPSHKLIDINRNGGNCWFQSGVHARRCSMTKWYFSDFFLVNIAIYRNLTVHRYVNVGLLKYCPNTVVSSNYDWKLEQDDRKRQLDKGINENLWITLLPANFGLHLPFVLRCFLTNSSQWNKVFMWRRFCNTCAWKKIN